MPRGRKRAVSPGKMKEWLRLFEVEGKSPPEIGDMGSDRYDARTVRKYLDIARQERETNEARAQVLRNALERHYEDLASFANKLDQTIAASRAPVVEKGDRMWSALRQHLPRSPIPKAIERWEQLHQEISTIQEAAVSRLVDAVGSSTFGFRDRTMAVGLDFEGLSSAVADRLKLVAPSQHEDTPTDDPRTELAGEGIVRIFSGDRSCGVVPLEQETQAIGFIRGLITQVSQWPERQSMQKALAELSDVSEELREDLATIVLRRVLPGRCKYCPI
jgi:hypothetical protein